MRRNNHTILPPPRLAASCYRCYLRRMLVRARDDMTLTLAAEPVVAAEREVRDHVPVMDDAIRGTLGGVFAPVKRVRGGGI